MVSLFSFNCCGTVGSLLSSCYRKPYLFDLTIINQDSSNNNSASFQLWFAFISLRTFHNSLFAFRPHLSIFLTFHITCFGLSLRNSLETRSARKWVRGDIMVDLLINTLLWFGLTNCSNFRENTQRHQNLLCLTATQFFFVHYRECIILETHSTALGDIMNHVFPIIISDAKFLQLLFVHPLSQVPCKAKLLMKL